MLAYCDLWGKTFSTCTAKTHYRKLEQKFPEKGLRGHSPNFYIHVSVSDLYIPPICLPILLQENRWTDPGNGYIDRSQTHECGNWDWGRAIPVLGAYKSKCLCSVFAVSSVLELVLNPIKSYSIVNAELNQVRELPVRTKMFSPKPDPKWVHWICST